MLSNDSLPLPSTLRNTTLPSSSQLPIANSAPNDHSSSCSSHKNCSPSRTRDAGNRINSQALIDFGIANSEVK